MKSYIASGKFGWGGKGFPRKGTKVRRSGAISLSRRYDAMNEVTAKLAAVEAAHATKTLAESGKQVERSTRQVSADTNRQVQLAADRTPLAAERTYAA